MNRRMGKILGVALLGVMLASCKRADPQTVQGYIEGEYVRVAAPYAGRLQAVSVKRGSQVEAGDALFAMDDSLQRAERDEAARRVDQARALLEDARKGMRPTEIEAIQAQISEAISGREYAQTELQRLSKLQGTGASAERDLDKAKADFDQAQKRVDQYSANLETAKLGSREQQVAAAESSLRAQESALAAAEWELAQMKQAALSKALVTDVLYRPGEWVPAGSPVIELLPPANVKVRVYVPQKLLGGIKLGDKVDIFIDGKAEKTEAEVVFISPQAEYTPPVIYSEEEREKFVYLIELAVAPEVAVNLHPGQPVEAHFHSTGSEGK